MSETTLTAGEVGALAQLIDQLNRIERHIASMRSDMERQLRQADADLAPGSGTTAAATFWAVFAEKTRPVLTGLAVHLDVVQEYLHGLGVPATASGGATT